MWNRNVVFKYTDQNYMISRWSYELRTTVAFGDQGLQMYGGAVIIITAPSKSPLIVYASRYLQNTVKIGINTEIKVNIGF